MITRYAFFNGTVKAGKEDEMRAWVATHLTPLWRQFEGAETVQVLHGVTQDPNGPEIPLVLAITYADEAAMERALASPARYQSRDLLPGFYAEFFEEVTLWHYVMQHDPFGD